MPTVAKVRQVLRWEGIYGLFRRAVRKSLGRVIRIQRVFFFETDLTKPLPIVRARVPLEIRVATRQDLEAFADNLEVAGFDRQEVRRRLECGDVATLALSGGRLANVGWITFSSPSITELGVSLLLDADEVCGYDAVTLPEWRGYGIQAAAANFRNHYERARGCTRHISWARSENVQSLKSIAKLGRKRTKTVWSIWVLGMKRPLLLGASLNGSPSLARLS